MKDYSVAFTNTVGGVFPNTLGINASGPSATDGTEFVKLFIDDLWGARQDLMVEAGRTPSGNDEAVGSSDFVAALKDLFWANLNMISGLNLSNNGADAQHDIDVATGNCMDSTNAYLFKLASGLIKQIDASWAVGTNAGGLFTGAVAADTYYGVFLIRKDSDGSIDAGFDTSVTAANIPGGYTAFRRIGWVLTDSSSNILAFTDVELAGGAIKRSWGAYVQDLVASPVPATTRQLVTISAPPNTIAQMSGILSDATVVYGTMNSTSDTDVAASAANHQMVVGSSSSTSAAVMELLVDGSSQVAYRVSTIAGAPDFFLSTLGYTDTRI